MNRAMRFGIGFFIVTTGMLSLGFRQAGPMPMPTTRGAIPSFEAQVIADHLVAPWSIVFLPDGRVLFTERAGRVRIIKDNVLQPEPALVVPDIKAWIKMGLLGMALDPAFATNRHVYLAECYGSDAERDSWVRVVRYDLDGEKLVSPQTLIEKIPAYLNHAGGRLAFGPDGKLYITTGDADRPRDAQDLKSLSGKILRINPDGSIPADNPFVNDPSAHPAIWSYGHRNAQGLAFEGDRLFAPEHGPNGGDEVNLIRRGGNFGWPIVSHDRSADGMISPLAEFSPAIGPAAGTVYHGAMFPELEGSLLVGCLRGESILDFRLNDDGKTIASTERLLFQKLGRIREVAVASDGALWITTSEVDPPEGRNREGYDQVIRLTRGDAPATSEPPRAIGGVALYAAHCRKCHGASAQGGEASDLTDRQWQFGGRDNDIRRAIRDGTAGNSNHDFGKRLTEEETEQLLRLIRIREEIYAR